MAAAWSARVRNQAAPALLAIAWSTLICAAALTGISGAVAAEVVKLYGAAGPAAAMKDAATEFSKRNPGVDLQLQAGPPQQWLLQAREDADLLFSGSASMMTELTWAMEGRIVEDSVSPLYFRPAVILVRPGNPKKITAVKDLLRPDVTVLVVTGAGQVGLWEDVVGRLGTMQALRSFRRNIAASAKDGFEAGKLWDERPDIDAWLSWNVWGVGERSKSEIVPIEKELRIYRPVEVALTRRAQQREPAVAFFAFLQSPDAKQIFEKWGWTSKAAD